MRDGRAVSPASLKLEGLSFTVTCGHATRKGPQVAHRFLHALPGTDTGDIQFSYEMNQMIMG